MDYRIVDIGREWPDEITDFSKVRNHFIDQLRQGEYILWKSEDEELSRTLLKYLEKLEGKMPYYNVLRINLFNGVYRIGVHNPQWSGHLVSKKVRYTGTVHEKIRPRKPYGRIDYPIIHNHPLTFQYKNPWLMNTPVFKLKTAVVQSMNILLEKRIEHRYKKWSRDVPG